MSKNFNQIPNQVQKVKNMNVQTLYGIINFYGIYSCCNSAITPDWKFQILLKQIQKMGKGS